MSFLQEILISFWASLQAMAPYLLLGFLIAGFLSVVISPAWVEKHLGRGRYGPVLKASLFGVPLPLCSCSVIPVVTALRRQGANRGASTAFLISTPQTGVDSIFVTYSLLGLPFALFRTAAAFLSGVIGGIWVALIDRKDEPEAPGPSAPAADSCCSSAPKKADGCCHGSPDAPAAGARLKAMVRQVLYHGFVVLPRDLAWPLLIGLLIAGVVATWDPAFLHEVSSRGMLSKLIMLAAGIPVYVCATATVPIAAALMLTGFSPGTVLVFLMAGPATNAATLTTIWKILGARSSTVYLISVAATALLFGVVMDLVWVEPVSRAMQHRHEAEGGWLATLSAILLLAVLVGTRITAPKAESCCGEAH